MREKYAHSYARFVLEKSDIKIFHGRKQILTPVNKNTPSSDQKWEYGDFVTEYPKGFSFLPESVKPTRTINDYSELIVRFGLMISKRRPTRPRFLMQKVEYFLTSYDLSKIDVGEIPRGHKIEIDFKNKKARLIGSHSLGNRFTYKKSPPAGDGYYGRKDVLFKPLQDTKDLMKEWLTIQEDEEDDMVQIENDLVAGICLDSGKLVAIPEENFNPIIAIFGIRRSGKSLFLTRLLDQIYHKWKKKCIVMDDPLREMDAHCLEWSKQMFLNKLNMIGEQTRSLPLVFLHPKTHTLKNLMCAEEVGFEITIPFKHLITDYENLLKGKETWEFKNTAVYFRNLLFDDYGRVRGDGLAQCKGDLNAIKDLVEMEIPKKLTGVKDRIINVMKDIFNSKILDVSNKTTSYWNVNYKKEDIGKMFSWNACMFADLIPVIVTSDIRKHFFYPQYMRFIMEDIFENQTNNELFIKNQSEVFEFFDEVTSVVHSKKETVVNESFLKTIRESGPARMGLVFATQDVSLVPEFARKQATYIFAFNQDADGINTITNDFPIFNSLKNYMKNLKTYECVAFSKTNKFHLYDEYGNVEVVENSPIRMLTFPSNSAHKPPKEIGG